jgi:hypothetical protein
MAPHRSVDPTQTLREDLLNHATPLSRRRPHCRPSTSTSTTPLTNPATRGRGGWPAAWVTIVLWLFFLVAGHSVRCRCSLRRGPEIPEATVRATRAARWSGARTSWRCGFAGYRRTTEAVTDAIDPHAGG